MGGFERSRCLLTCAAAAVALAASGCKPEDDPETMLIDYVERVERVTETEVLDNRNFRTRLLAYPDRRDRRLPLTDVRIGMFDFLVLIQCDLQQIIGERNSALGKVMPVSQQLLYEHRLLVSARRCRQQLDGGLSEALELRHKLDDVVEVKTADLPRAYWNATFGSPEFAYMFSLAAAPVSLSAAHDSGGDIGLALQHLAALGARLGDASLELESSWLEGHYKVLYSRRVAGEVLGALDLLRHYLDRAALAIETRLASRPVCHDRRATPRARILDTVFRKYYIARVQPYLASVHRQAYDWLTRVNRLANQQHGQMTATFRRYFDAQLSLEAEGALWATYERALDRHTKAWQTVLGQCGLMPGSSGGHSRGTTGHDSDGAMKAAEQGPRPVVRM